MHSRKRYFLSIGLLFFLTFSLLQCTVEKEEEGKASYIFTNGTIFTAEDSLEFAQFVAIVEDTIAYVGDGDGIEALIGAQTELIDLDGRMLLPGFVESHAHLTIGAVFAQGVWLADLETKEEFLEKIEEYAKSDRTKPYIRGFGWKTYAFDGQGPTKTMLDKIDSVRPIELFDITGHASWVNSAALDSAGIDKNTIDPRPGFSYFQRDRAGVPTGYIVELEAEFMVSDAIDSITIRYMENGLEEWINAIPRAGITTIYDPGFVTINHQDRSFDVLSKRDSTEGLPFRMVASYYANKPDELNISKFNALQSRYKSDRLAVNVLKIVVDGDPFNHLALLSRPYFDQPGNVGKSAFDQKQLTALVLEAFKNDIDLHFHAMGDESVHYVLNALEEARNKYPSKDIRASLAHGYLIKESDLPRIAELGLIVSYSGHWFGPNRKNKMAKKLLGTSRANDLYKIRTMSEYGATLTIGSNWPTSGSLNAHNVLKQIEMMHTRQLAGRKEGAIQPNFSEFLDLRSLLKAATINGAKQLHLEDKIGSIKVGKWADLVVLDKNIFEVPKHDIHKVKVEMTFLGGELRE